MIAVTQPATVYFDHGSTAKVTVTITGSGSAATVRVMPPRSEPLPAKWPDDALPFVPLMADFEDLRPSVVRRQPPPKILQPWQPSHLRASPRETTGGAVNFRSKS